MLYAIVENDTIVKWGPLETLYPNISFPSSGPEPEWIEAKGLYNVITTRPYDVSTEKLINVEPYFDGVNVYCVKVESRSPDDIAAERHNMIVSAILNSDMTVVSSMTTQERSEYEELTWRVVRERRDYLLQKNDWTQLPDAPVDSAAWATYRQQLRDVTNQLDPFEIIWPTPPN